MQPGFPQPYPSSQGALPPQQPGFAQQGYAQAGPSFQPHFAARGGYGRPGPGEPFDGAANAADLDRPLYGATIGQSFVRFFKNYVNFSGRASRSEFWWMALITWGAIFLLGIVVALIEEATSARYSPLVGAADALIGMLGILFAVFMLGIIVPWISIGWRRLHDANLAGPLYLLNLIPYLGSLVVFIFTLLPPRPEGRRFDRYKR